MSLSPDKNRREQGAIPFAQHTIFKYFVHMIIDNFWSQKIGVI